MECATLQYIGLGVISSPPDSNPGCCSPVFWSRCLVKSSRFQFSAVEVSSGPLNSSSGRSKSSAALQIRIERTASHAGCSRFQSGGLEETSGGLKSSRPVGGGSITCCARRCSSPSRGSASARLRFARRLKRLEGQGLHRDHNRELPGRQVEPGPDRRGSPATDRGMVVAEELMGD